MYSGRTNIITCVGVYTGIVSKGENYPMKNVLSTAADVLAHPLPHGRGSVHSGLWALCLVVCLLAATSLFVSGQAKPAAKTEAGAVEQTLMQMERDWTQALIKKDAATLDRIIADDWAGIDFDGKTFAKADVLADLKSGSNVLQSVDLGEMKVRVFGNTAVVTGSDTEKSSYKGKDTSGRYVWTDVFVQRNGRWQAAASQSVKAPK